MRLRTPFAPPEQVDTLPAVDWLAALGHLHPILLHLPIGFVIALVVLELSALRRPDVERVWWRPMLSATVVCAALAVASGWCLATARESSSALVERHREDALWLLGGLLVWWGSELALREGRIRRALRLAGLGFAMIFVGIVGHQGGTLSHGRGFATRHAPTWIANLGARADAWLLPALANEPSATASATSALAREVSQIIDRHCVACHGPDEQEGDLRLDGLDHLQAQVEPGQVLLSPLLERVLLAPTDPDVMPPADEPPLTASEIMSLVEWVRGGARR